MFFRLARQGLAGVAAVGFIAASFASPSQADIQYGDTITIHESILIEESPVAIWARYGGYCAIPDWVIPITSCVYDEGMGQLGTIRRIFVEGLGELREVKSVQSSTSYTYEIISEGPLATAKYRSTIWTVPGPRAGTAEVHWRTTILKSAFPEDDGVGTANALSGLYSSSLANLKTLVE